MATVQGRQPKRAAGEERDWFQEQELAAPTGALASDEGPSPAKSPRSEETRVPSPLPSCVPLDIKCDYQRHCSRRGWHCSGE